MKKIVSFVFLLLFAASLHAAAIDQYKNGIVMYEGNVKEIDSLGDLVLDVRTSDFIAKGYKLGDTVDLVFGNGFHVNDVPFISGKFVRRGELMLVSFPNTDYIMLGINFGDISKVGRVAVGEKVTINVNRQAGAYQLQLDNATKNSDNRSDYSSDETFADFREVKVGHIGDGRLYRSASPVNNEHKRAVYANRFARTFGIKGVLNIEDSFDNLEGLFSSYGFSSDYYKSLYERGNVVGLSIDCDFRQKRFAKDITLAIACLVRNRIPAPYLIHYTSDRISASFACALIECLMGASYKEILNDYMQSYKNYYGAGVKTIESDTRYNVIMDNTINEMLFVICRVDNVKDLVKADMKKCAREFLEANGMSGREIDELMFTLV